jgi:hypothetical protein
MLGLIQFNGENQRKYGVTPDQSVTDQMGAVESYLRDRGVKPGMGMLDLYSAINAGRPGLYDRSDANNGGAPGTVADKVATQMVGHRARANAMLGGDYSVTDQPSGASPAPTQVSAPAATQPQAAPQAMPSTENGAEAPSLPDVGQAIAARTPQAPQPVSIDVPQPTGLPVAQKLAMIMQKLQAQQAAQNGS